MDGAAMVLTGLAGAAFAEDQVGASSDVNLLLGITPQSLPEELSMTVDNSDVTLSEQTTGLAAAQRVHGLMGDVTVTDVRN
ncbi:MAG: hypothetical protein LBU05_01435 [Bifidobacteriaceae bacterium]|jgi:hypothetical protein|nr:hypothetical protein [Bifidobacteriaceae bacterium]